MSTKRLSDLPEYVVELPVLVYENVPELSSAELTKKGRVLRFVVQARDEDHAANLVWERLDAIAGDT